MAKQKKSKVQSQAPSESPISLQDFEFVQAVKSVCERAGIPSWMLLFPAVQPKNPGDIAIHLNNIKFKEALMALMTAVNYVVNLDLKNHPEYSNEYSGILHQFLAALMGVVDNTNKKLDDFRKSHTSASSK